MSIVMIRGEGVIHKSDERVLVPRNITILPDTRILLLYVRGIWEKVTTLRNMAHGTGNTVVADTCTYTHPCTAPPQYLQ